MVLTQFKHLNTFKFLFIISYYFHFWLLFSALLYVPVNVVLISHNLFPLYYYFARSSSFKFSYLQCSSFWFPVLFWSCVMYLVWFPVARFLGHILFDCGFHLKSSLCQMSSFLLSAHSSVNEEHRQRVQRESSLWPMCAWHMFIWHVYKLWGAVIIKLFISVSYCAIC